MGELRHHADQATERGPSPARHGAARTVWEATASRRPLRLPSLAADIRVPVAVVGAGMTGLSAAYHLSRAGFDCVVIEAAEPGFGASGRTAGFVVPRFRRRYADLDQAYGRVVARHLHAVADDALATLLAMIADCGLADTFVPCGHITAAHNGAALDILEKEAAWLASEVADGSVRLIGRREIAERIGSGVYPGGLLDTKGGALQPVDFVRGLAAAVAARGTRLFVHSPVQDVRVGQDGVVVRTRGGDVSAQHLVVATNAQGSCWPGRLHRCVLPLWTSVMATSALGPKRAAGILPGGHTVTDTNTLVRGFRRLPNGRIIAAGIADITRERATAAAYGRIRQGFAAAFPDVDDVAFDLQWSGRIALTSSGLPHVGSLGARTHFAFGYGGRGITLAALMGKHLALRVQGHIAELGPISAGPAPAMRGRALRLSTMSLGILGHRALTTARTWIEGTVH